jgi:hypothetical protein
MRMRWRPDDLWQAFLVFCGERKPTADLAAQFARVATAEMDEPVRSLRASSTLIVLQTRLIGAANARNRN